MKKAFLNFIPILIIFLIFSCNQNKSSVSYEEILCDAEYVSADSSVFQPSGKFKGIDFSNGKNQTSKVAHSGKYSVLLNKRSRYGMSYSIDNVLANDTFEISVWRNSKNNNGVLVASAEQTDKFYASQKDGANKDENGWELLTLKIVIPEQINRQSLKVYVWNPDTANVAYFDDLKIQYLNKPKEN